MDQDVPAFQLGKLEGKVDAILLIAQDLKGTLSKHDERLRTVEKRQSWFLGLGAAAGGLVAFLTPYLRSPFS